MEIKDKVAELEKTVLGLQDTVSELSKTLDEKIDSAELQIEVIAGSVANLETDTEQLRNDLDEARAKAPEVSTAKGKKKVKKPGVGNEFKVDKKTYKFKYPVIRVALESRGGKMEKLLVEKLNANDKKEIVAKYPGVVEEV